MNSIVPGPVHIDGSQGEGGGQMLRSSVTLSVLTGRPLVVENIRARRSRPGMKRAHVAAVSLLAEICGARHQGLELNSMRLEFNPGPPRSGSYRYAVGSAGSTSLIFQTVLLPLLAADGSSKLVLEGGTHNPMAPTFEFLDRSFLPLLRRMGARVEARLIRHGFYPAGGGRIEVELEGPTRWLDLELCGRLEQPELSASVLVAELPNSIGHREAQTLRRKLGAELPVQVQQVESAGPGNVIQVHVDSTQLTETICEFGELNVAAERVARRATNVVRRYLHLSAPVGIQLADQLLLPMALTQGSRFDTDALSLHARSNIEVIERFLGRSFYVQQEGQHWHVSRCPPNGGKSEG